MTTENHRFNIPEQGTLDWDEPLNENFQKIDTDVEIRDTEANLGQYTPKDGAKYFATDTGNRYLGDGNQWNDAPIHLPDLLTVPAYSEDDPTERTAGELWYRTDLDALVVQTQNEIINIMTGEVLSSTSSTDGNSDDTSDSTDDSETTTDTAQTLEIAPADSADWDNYSVVIDGEVSSTQNTNSGDTITEQSDGTLLIEGGVMGGKDPEIYNFTGELLSLSLQVDATAYLDGQAIDVENY